MQPSLSEQAVRFSTWRGEEARETARELDEDGVPLRDIPPAIGACRISAHTNFAPTYSSIDLCCSGGTW